MSVSDQQVTPRVGAALLRDLESRIDVSTSGHELIDVDSPFTLDIFGRIPQATSEDVAAAVLRLPGTRHGFGEPDGDTFDPEALTSPGSTPLIFSRNS